MRWRVSSSSIRPVTRKVRTSGWRVTTVVSTPIAVMDDADRATTPGWLDAAEAWLAATRSIPQTVHLPAWSDLIHGCIGHW